MDPVLASSDRHLRRPRLILEIGPSVAEPLHVDDGGLQIYLVHNSALENLLFNRNLIGTGFRRSCLAASRHFVRHLADECVSGDVAELMILSKGMVYQLAEAFSQEIGANLPTNLLATSRVAVVGDAADVEVSYASLEAPADTLLIGDTIASGATVVAALSRYLDEHPLSRIYVLSYAGTLVGARRIAEFCRERGVQPVFLYGLAAFGLGDNGFDLSFLHPETISRSSYIERAAEQFSGKPVSAVGWDFGSQCTAPDKYRALCWAEAELWGLHHDDCLAIAERPKDWSVLTHERAAYEKIIDPGP